MFRQYPGAALANAIAVAQHVGGFLWIGTQTGLARWDGYRFRRYEAGPSKPGALADAFVTALHTDGVQWAGTRNALSRRSSARAVWRPVPLPGPSGAALGLRLQRDSAGRNRQRLPGRLDEHTLWVGGNDGVWGLTPGPGRGADGDAPGQ